MIWGEPAQPSRGGLSHIYNGCVTIGTIHVQVYRIYTRSNIGRHSFEENSQTFFLNRDECEAPDIIAALSRWKLQEGPKSRKNYNKAQKIAPRTLQKAWKSDRVPSLQLPDRQPTPTLASERAAEDAPVGASCSGDPARIMKQRRRGNPTAAESGAKTGTSRQ
jgi:hypothetical protein